MLALAAGVIASWAVNSYRIGNLEDAKKEANNRVHELEEKMNNHIANTTLHIDPHRDKAIWEDFQGQVMRRFDGIDRKFDKVMLVLPTPPIV